MNSSHPFGRNWIGHYDSGNDLIIICPISPMQSFPNQYNQSIQEKFIGRIDSGELGLVILIRMSTIIVVIPI